MAGKLDSSIKAARSQATTTVITRSDYSRIAKLEPAEIAEAEAISDEDLEADLLIDPALAFDIQMRRQEATGVTESPNREDEESLAEDMWEEER